MAKIGFIIYVIIKTYINIIFAILIVIYFIKNLKLDCFNIVNKILRYLASSQDKKIVFGNESEFQLIG